ncbi:MAG: hypothetical protein WD176_10450, partial [Pirellulales bacterium]
RDQMPTEASPENITPPEPTMNEMNEELPLEPQPADAGEPAASSNSGSSPSGPSLAGPRLPAAAVEPKLVSPSQQIEWRSSTSVRQASGIATSSGAKKTVSEKIRTVSKPLDIGAALPAAAKSNATAGWKRAQ